jgi:Uma2 family endonuclease
MLPTPAPGTGEPPTTDPDQRVVMHGLDWWQFETMLAIRGDRAGVRFAFLEGALEIMSPSLTHEFIKKAIARLLEAYAEEAGLFFNGYGSLTMKQAPKQRAVEPDECYVVGTAKERPDLAIEVIWTSGGIDKRRIYAGLGVGELWEWQGGRITVLVLRGGAYVEVAQSEVLPALDLGRLSSFIEREDQTQAVREFRALVRERRAQ